MADNTFEKNKTVSPNHKKLGGQKPKIGKEVKYADPPAVKPDQSKSLDDARDKFAKNADKPTTASGESGDTDLVQLVKKVDPQGKAQALPEMYNNLMQMKGILGLGSGMGGGFGGGGGGGGGQQIQPPIPAGISSVIEDSFTGALAILTRRYGFERVISVFVNLLADGTNGIDYRFVNIVKNSIANLIKIALYYGPLNIPVSQYDETVYGDIVPSPLVQTPPDLYIKQYYPIQYDPYPGYIEYKSQDGKQTVYVKREPQSYVFVSSSEEIFSISEREIAEDLDPYITITNPLTLTKSRLNEILLSQVDNIDNNISDFNMGNNTGSQNSNSSSNLIGMLGGQLQQLLSMFQSEQLPKSVLEQGDIQKTIQQFTKDMSFNNQLFEIGNKAMGGGLGGALGSFGNMGGLGNIMGGFMDGGGGISGILSNLGGGSLFGGFGGFGGGSNGGGGGAGSGFPSATPGTYSGGDVSESGMKDISQLLTLLGIV